MDDEADLVERGLRATAHLGLVLCTPTALEALDRLALAGGGGQRLAALGDGDVATAEVGGRVDPTALRALHPRLDGEEVGARGAVADHGVAPEGARRGDGRRGLAEDRLARDAVRQLTGELLAGLVLRALAQGLHPLQAERERLGLHAPVHRPSGA
jgi:hypothetical protein